MATAISTCRVLNKASSCNDLSDNDEDERVNRLLNYHSQNHHYIVGAKSLNYVMQWEDLEFVDFIERCLDLDHRRRLTARDALKHPWIIKGLK